MSEIGVVYIARGLDPHWQARITRFVDSWMAHPPGIECHVYVIYKEFLNSADLTWAIDKLLPLWPTCILNYRDYNSWGGGCFKEAVNHVTEPLLCTLVSSAEVMHNDWLAKLYNAFNYFDAGLVGCTGSRELNLHIRDNAILIERARYEPIIKQFNFRSKADYDEFEHGPDNLTLQVLRDKPVYVIERDGRAFASVDWDHITYTDPQNVLVHDCGSRHYKDGLRWD